MSNDFNIPKELPYIPFPKISDDFKSEATIAFEKEVNEVLGNREGIKELSEVLVALFKGLDCWKEAMANGSIGFEDSIILIRLFQPILNAIEGAEKIGKEVTDVITEEEILALQKIVTDSGLDSIWKDKVIYGLKALYYIKLCIG